MKSFLFILFCCSAIATQAQNLTGIWRGSFISSSDPATNRLMELMGAEDRYKFEVQIDQNDKKFEGVTYSYKTTVFYGKAVCKGTVNPATRKVLLEELKIVEVRMAGGDACIMTLFMQYSKVGDEEIMEGNYTSINTRDSTSCGRGTVFLRKVPTSDFYKEPFLVEKEKAKERPKIAEKKPNITKTQPKVDSPSTRKPVTTTKPPVTKKTESTTTKPKTTPNNTAKKPVEKPAEKDTASKVVLAPADTAKRAVVKAPEPPATPKILLSRENELVKTIVTTAPEVIVNIYDNGTIDNDTVSVYLNKKLVLQKKRLTEQPLTLKFKLDEDNDVHELVMVAENLGEIPPNTSLMVVKAGNEQYEVRITSTEQKNAVVVFRYKKPK